MFVQTGSNVSAGEGGGLYEENRPEHISVGLVNSPDHVSQSLNCAQLVKSGLIQELLYQPVEQTGFDVTAFLGTLEVGNQT